MLTYEEKSLNLGTGTFVAVVLSPMFGFGTHSWLVGIGSFLLLSFGFTVILGIWSMHEQILNNQKKIMFAFRIPMDE